MSAGDWCVSGGTGFIGKRLLSRLGAEGARARVLTRGTRPLVFGEPFRGDLLDRASLAGLVAPGSTVVHLAYLAGADREQNLAATSHLIEACREGGARRLIHVSTAVVAGDSPDEAVSEASPCAPQNPYESVKLEIERRLLDGLEGRCEVVVLRPTAVFGPEGKNLVRLARQLMESSAGSRALRRAVLAHRRLNLVYVDTVVEAILHLARRDVAGLEDVYIVSEDDEPTNNYRDVADFLCAEWRLPPTPALPTLPPGLLKLAFAAIGKGTRTSVRTYDAQRLRRSGFVKPVPFHEGLRRFAASFSLSGSA